MLQWCLSTGFCQDWSSNILSARQYSFSNQNHQLTCSSSSNLSQDRLRLLSETMTVYHDSGETVFNCKAYAMVAPYRCLKQSDLHSIFLFNLRSVFAVDYLCLQKFILYYNKGGTTHQAFYSNIKTSCDALNLPYSLSYNHFLSACDGFNRFLKWDFEMVFSCPNCKTSQSGSETRD